MEIFHFFLIAAVSGVVSGRSEGRHYESSHSIYGSTRGGIGGGLESDWLHSSIDSEDVALPRSVKTDIIYQESRKQS